jgi:SSS family solute:Na+ symporter/sodium/pantothenate symporter
VFPAGFVVGLGLIAQPHVLTKALYLRSDRDMRAYLAVGVLVCIVYALVLFAGLYARVQFPDIPAQDEVMPIYLDRALPSWLGVPVAVTLLAAGMSTLDGILVSASTIAANDVFLGALGSRMLSERSEEERGALALKASRSILVAMGLTAFLIALDPPKLVGIFAQWGIYGLVSASFGPIALGVLAPRTEARAAFAAAVVGPALHFGVYAWVTVGQGEVLNPAVSASIGILGSLLAAAAVTLTDRPAEASLPRRANPSDTPIDPLGKDGNRP